MPPVCRLYEISNHARPGAECRHNLIYWTGGDYIGIGPGAHGRLTLNGSTFATQEIPHPQNWLKTTLGHKNPEVRRDLLDPEERAEERIMMGLRSAAGVESKPFEAAIGLPLTDFLSETGLAAAKEHGLVEWDGQVLRATAKGRPVLNALLAEIIV